MPPFWANFPPPTQPATSPDTPGSSNEQGATTPLFPGIPLLSPSNFYPIIQLPPVPVPPPNLTALSEEELRQMEGNLRQAVEHRIETLRRVQLLIDAAITMMGQYQTAAQTAM